TSRKPASGFTKKKEGETNVVASRDSKSYPAQVPYFPYLAVAQHQPSQGYTLPQAIQMPVNPAPQQAQQQARKVFDLIPVPYSQLLPYL
ncbi:hypothetical protein A2U01_0074687, partial [Trifolium medium]|nr:hypothetical protein [Trifolium medium]